MRSEKGWLRVPSIRPNGDRTIEEQMLGLSHGLDEVRRLVASGAAPTVLDLGCAEGLIAREFALAGAASVLGVEMLETHLEVARLACADAPQIRFVRAELSKYIAEAVPAQYDVVLALGIAHKLKQPAQLMEFAARSASGLLAFRAPAWGQGGWVRSKFGGGKCHVPTIMEAHGFSEERMLDGPRGERVQYWRKK